MADAVVVFLIYMVGIFAALAVGCIVADYIFPRIPFIQRWLDTLPDWDEEEEW